MRHSVRARLRQTLTCAGAALALPGSAFAAESSPLHIDPASPVAKEYALPLSTARGAAPESGQAGKLFGSGLKHAATVTRTVAAPAPPLIPTVTTSPATVNPPPATVPSPAVTTTAGPAPQRHPHRHRPGPKITPTHTPRATASRPLIARATPAAYRVLRPGSGSGLLWMVVAALLVVALGSAGGLALRRRR